MKSFIKVRYILLGKFLKDSISEDRTYFALTLIVGLLSALVVIALHHGVLLLREVLHTSGTFTWESFLYGGVAIFVSGWLTTRKLPWTAGSGIPNVRIALAVFHGKISLKDTVGKFFTSLLSLGSGVSLGLEGPAVATSAGLGSFLGNYFSLSKKRVQALVAVGSASGVAAAFHTPISAVVFTLEEVVGDLNAKILGSIIISSVIAVVTSQMLTNTTEVFQEVHYRLTDHRELIFYLVIGLAASVVGPIWMNSVLKLREFNQKFMNNHKLTFIMIAFCCVGLLSQIHPGVIGSGSGTLEGTLLSLILDPKILITLFILKFISTSICYSSGMSGGLFMPTLFMGATLGSFIGVSCSYFFPEVTSVSGAYALVGMGAFFAVVIRAPFTSILMVFELTRDYNIMLPLMIANITAYVISAKIEHKSIYEKISEQDGIHLPSHDDNEILESLTVEDAMEHNVISLNSSLTLIEAYKGIRKESISGYPILKNGRLIGMIAKSDMSMAIGRKEFQKKLEELCEKKVIKIYPDQSLLVAFHRLKRFQISRLPVVSRLDDKRLVGVITAQDIVQKFGYELTESTKEEDQIIEDLEIT
ncbi:chloride channel protein [Halobacteriovorax sp. JY17]|uniref:chloride channel protein n=1 Tax=Halobacteriovorax sp. JY17 TaxID=2014617 RepID=UPI000C4DEC1A|nr:chloride channel protein [Halobacteriovorax sp. JY17]PIK14620.1 MAG: hypothetical protein CES88_09790 [Halobacteriovorax sp. JY17]